MPQSLRLLPILLALMLVAMPGHAGETLDPAIAAALDAQPAAAKSRYPARHPAETLAFFGIRPGMTVFEALPGGGWYTRILAPGLGPESTLVGVDYAPDMFPLFGFFSAEFIAGKKTWTDTFVRDAAAWAGDEGAAVDAFVFGALPERLAGKADAFLLVRALHNLARFEDQGGYLSAALADIYRAVKPGGVVGVVQHLAPETASDDWANGSNGYLKRSFVVSKLEGAGFELVGESDINLNPLDQPTESDRVWRLPPSFSTSRKDPELKQRYAAIGESTRMTLLFRKPQ